MGFHFSWGSCGLSACPVPRQIGLRPSGDWSNQDSLQPFITPWGNGLHLIIINQGIMYDPAVIGIEGTHFHRLATLLGLGRQLLSGLNEFLLLSHAETVTVNPDTRRVLNLFLKDPVDQILKVIKAVPVLANEKATLLSKNLQAGPFLTLFLLNRHLKPKLGNHGLKNLVRFREGFHGCSLERGTPRSSRVSLHLGSLQRA